MKNISEPVLTIVKLLKETPERFEFKEQITYNVGISQIQVKDKDTDLCFSVAWANDYANPRCTLLDIDWLTTEEMHHLGTTCLEVYRGDTQRQKAAEREKWTNIYSPRGMPNYG